MDCFTEDLWAIILSRLPLKIITSWKLVCKQWKSIVESPYFRDMFQSLHQNSHSSSWSLISCDDGAEFVAHYRCNTLGLERSLGYYISSFLTKTFKTQRVKYKVCAYTDVGLILISEANHLVEPRSWYVANPVSQECVQLPSRKELSRPLGIVTRTENGILLDYKVVLLSLDGHIKTGSSLLIYSSETGLWSLITFHLSLSRMVLKCPTSVDGNIHWLASDSHNEYVYSIINVYSTGTGSIQCLVTPFPDLGKNHRIKRTLTASQGFLMYMNIVSVPKVDGSLEDKLCVWRLNSGEWQLVSEITPPFIDSGFDYFSLGINPSDSKTAYFWSMIHQSLMSINLRNGNFVLHNELEHRDGHILSSVECGRVMKYHKGLQFSFLLSNKGSHFSLYVFPRWLHRIPGKTLLHSEVLNKQHSGEIGLKETKPKSVAESPNPMKEETLHPRTKRFQVVRDSRFTPRIDSQH